MNAAADRDRAVDLAAFVIVLVVVVSAGLLVHGHLTGDQWVDTVTATVRAIVVPVLGPQP